MTTSENTAANDTVGAETNEATKAPLNNSPRGFALYVGIDEHKAAKAGIDLSKLVEALKALTAELAPGAETYAAVALAPKSAGGRDVDVVRLALQEPAIVHRMQRASGEPSKAVIVDISRKRVLIDDEIVPLTFKEFELLQFLITYKGRTVTREQLIKGLWHADEEEIPSDRTIDVHVRRLRSKLGRFEDIIRTDRGVGYRYDVHADVTVLHASAPSPDVF